MAGFYCTLNARIKAPLNKHPHELVRPLQSKKLNNVLTEQLFNTLCLSFEAR